MANVTLGYVVIGDSPDRPGVLFIAKADEDHYIYETQEEAFVWRDDFARRFEFVDYVVAAIVTLETDPAQEGS